MSSLFVLRWLPLLLTLVLSCESPCSADGSVSSGNGGDPASDTVPPESLQEVRIGYFGPSDRSDQAWLAAQLALHAANREGGYQGLPFKLIPVWSENPWGSGIAVLAKTIYRDCPWAMIGSIDGTATHLVEQLVAKARLTLINPASSDSTVNLANVPWMFSCLPGEQDQSPLLAEAIAQTHIGPPHILSSTDHDSRVFVQELKHQLALAGAPSGYHFELDAGLNGLDGLIDALLAAPSNSVVVVGSTSTTAAVLRRLRTRGYEGNVFGGPQMGRAAFLTEAGPAADGAVFPYLVNPRLPASFVERFRSELGSEPDYVACQTFDAVNLLVEAIRKAGLDRTGIRDNVRELSPWEGISGPIIWDALGRNQRPVTLARIYHSRVVPMDRLRPAK